MKVQTYFKFKIINEALVSIGKCKKMIFKNLKNRDFEKMWNDSNPYKTEKGAELKKKRDSLLSNRTQTFLNTREQKIGSTGKKILLKILKFIKGMK